MDTGGRPSDSALPLRPGEPRGLDPVLPGTMPRSLHPLARQALISASRPDWAWGWGFCLTRYLSANDPLRCVRFAFDILRPFLRTVGEAHEVEQRTGRFLESVLADPESAVLKDVSDFAWLPWNYRGAGPTMVPLARAVWAAAGALGIDRPTEFESLDDLAEGDARRLVWEQSATVIRMLRELNDEIPQLVARAFTDLVGGPPPEPDAVPVRRLNWSLENLRFDIDVLQQSGAGFHLRFIDCNEPGVLHVGPFPDHSAVDADLAALREALPAAMN